MFPLPGWRSAQAMEAASRFVDIGFETAGKGIVPMARARNIKPGFFTSDELAECEPLARILFAGLWCWADRDGRLEERPKKLKAEILPYDRCDVEKLLDQLTQQGFIIRYVAGGSKYIQVKNFGKHQNPHMKENPSTIPPPESIRQEPDKSGAGRENTGTDPADSLSLDSLIPHPDSPIPQTSICVETEIPSSTPDDASDGFNPVVLSFPCDGTPNAWPLVEAQLAEWRELYPSLDLLAECKSALAWVLADSSRRKTARGMRKFLVGWFGRSQNNGNGRRVSVPAGGSRRVVRFTPEQLQ